MTTPITVLPVPPATSDPVNFDVRADDFLGALPTFRTELNTLGSEVEVLGATATTQAGIATTAAATATTQAGIATTQAGIATTAASAAAASAVTCANLAGAFVSTSTTSWTPAIGTQAFTVQANEQYTAGVIVIIVSTGTPTARGTGQVTSYSGTTLTVDVQHIKGSGAHTDWNISISGEYGDQGDPGVDGASTLVRSARTSNTILGTADKSTLIDITSGAFTQTFTAAATLTDGWWCYIRNSGTGDITLDPNSSEQIDGLTSFIMYPGECRIVQCTGTAFNSVVLNSFHRSFLSTGTFTKPPGYKKFAGLLWGAGGSGGRSDNGTYYGAGGGGGACVPFNLASSAVGTTETVTIGAGGAAKASGAGQGNVGGNSTFGALVTSYGGGAGGGSNSANHNGGGGGGALSEGLDGISTTITYGGQPLSVVNGDPGTASNSGFGGASCMAGGAGYSAYGGAAGGGGLNQGGAAVYGGSGGSSNSGANRTSVFGGNGSLANYAGTASAGAQPGGGGGGTQTGTSGAGGDGQCDIWGVI